MTPYELHQREDGDPARVHLDIVGELDLTNASEVEEQLEHFVSDGSSLVLDMNRVVFIDSAALHVLFRTARRLGKEHFVLLFDPEAAIARTLGIVGILDVATLGAAEEPQPS